MMPPWRSGASNEANKCYGKGAVGGKCWKRIEMVTRIEKLCSGEVAHSAYGTDDSKVCSK